MSEEQTIWRNASDYYRKAESDDWMRGFWKPETVFRQLFDKLNRSVLLELAPGHGRHLARILHEGVSFGQYILVDFVDENVDFCLRRFPGAARGDREMKPLIFGMRNNGLDFQPLTSASVTGIFSYDAMVHFSPQTVASYLKDTARILVPGGKALYHHSNLWYEPDSDYRRNSGWRNTMSASLFASIAQENGLLVRSQYVLDWDAPRTDCLTLLEKPYACGGIIPCPE